MITIVPAIIPYNAIGNGIEELFCELWNYMICQIDNIDDLPLYYLKLIKFGSKRVKLPLLLSPCLRLDALQCDNAYAIILDCLPQVKYLQYSQ